jgi:tRNA threonylcarbamoyladenosine biosynthesis protein TsaB
MLLLAADTSGKNGSIALVRADFDHSAPAIRKFESLEVVPLEGGTFSAQLVPQISDLLARHRFNKKDLDAFVVVSGPGSFTGLRVGLAAIKGLAEVLKKPIAAVSLLEAVARFANHHGRVWAALDAGRHEVFLGDYDFLRDEPCVSEELLAQEEVVATLRANIGSLFATPDQKLAELVSGHALPVLSVQWPRSDFIARIGLEKILAGKTVLPEDLEANYIRRSDAEIFSKPRD